MGGPVATIIAIVLAVAFLAAGVAKLRGVPQMRDNLRRIGVSPPLQTVIGVLEVLAFVGLLIGFAQSWLAVVTAVCLVLLMVGAVVFHIRAGDGPQGFAPPLVLGVLALILVFLI